MDARLLRLERHRKIDPLSTEQWKIIGAQRFGLPLSDAQVTTTSLSILQPNCAREAPALFSRDHLIDCIMDILEDWSFIDRNKGWTAW